MAPSAWVRLEALPLTPNGKLDRKALPAPAAQCYTGRGYEAPQGEVESQIAGIWAEILKLDRAGRNDDFFELGGHSLLAVRLASRLRQAFDVDVPINELFGRPVLSSLAEYVLDKQLELYDPACLSEALEYMDKKC
jgi:acyl carrier protein